APPPSAAQGGPSRRRRALGGPARAASWPARATPAPTCRGETCPLRAPRRGTVSEMSRMASASVTATALRRGRTARREDRVARFVTTGAAAAEDVELLVDA